MDPKRFAIPILVVFISLLGARALVDQDIWDWMVTAGLALFVIHMFIGGYQLLARFPQPSVESILLDTAILAALFAMIWVQPDPLRVFAASAVIFMLIPIRYYLLIKRTTGSQKEYAAKKFRLEAPLTPLFLLFLFVGVNFPSIFTPQLQSVMVLLFHLVAVVWLVIISPIYRS